MIVNIYASRKGRRFILMPFGRDEAGLSVTVGEFRVLGWEQFRTEGLGAVKEAIKDYCTVRNAGLSEIDRMSREERITFVNMHIGFQVTQRDQDLWWIDLTRPVADGSIASPMGPPYRVHFHPSQGAGRFFEALIQLMMLDEAYSEN